ncbi:MAG TPA: hypothetical protein VMR18_00635 [Candidatus Saccharimonadales bacterium]|nr:hypothetical protein [Candidatus Saccharimonadales bacterium]
MAESDEHFDDASLEDFLAEGQAAESAAQRVDEIRTDFEGFLLSRGLSFDIPALPDYLASPETREGLVIVAIDGQETRLGRELTKEETETLISKMYEEMTALRSAHVRSIASIYDQRSRLEILALTLAMIESGEGKLTHEQQTDLKKRLQARSIVDGEDSIWRELIAKKFPGDPLTDDDTDILADEALKNTLETEETKRQLNDLKKEMLDYLLGLGEDTTSLEAHGLILQLALYVQRARLLNNSAPFIEEARLAAIKSGVSSNNWESLINKLFNAG